MRRAFPAAALVAVAALALPAGVGAAQPQARVLVVTETAAFRHTSIGSARIALRRLDADSGVYDVVDRTGLGPLTPRRLRRYDVVASRSPAVTSERPPSGVR